MVPESAAPMEPAGQYAADLTSSHDARPSSTSVAGAEPEVPRSPSGAAIAPLVGESPAGRVRASGTADSVVDTSYPTGDLGDPSVAVTPPIATATASTGHASPSSVQRSGTDRPTRTPGLGAPLPTGPTGRRADSPRGQSSEPAPPRPAQPGMTGEQFGPPAVQRAVAMPVAASASSAPSAVPASIWPAAIPPVSTAHVSIPTASAATTPAAQSVSDDAADQSEGSASAVVSAPLLGSAGLMRVIDSPTAGTGSAGGAPGASADRPGTTPAPAATSASILSAPSAGPVGSGFADTAGPAAQRVTIGESRPHHACHHRRGWRSRRGRHCADRYHGDVHPRRRVTPVRRRIGAPRTAR